MNVLVATCLGEASELGCHLSSDLNLRNTLPTPPLSLSLLHSLSLVDFHGRILENRYPTNNTDPTSGDGLGHTQNCTLVSLYYPYILRAWFYPILPAMFSIIFYTEC